jgi:hypothetical protein
VPQEEVGDLALLIMYTQVLHVFYCRHIDQDIADEDMLHIDIIKTIIGMCCRQILIRTIQSHIISYHIISYHIISYHIISTCPKQHLN